MEGQYGLTDVCLSMPAIVGKDGVEEKIPISLDEDEITNLMASARALKAIADELDLTLPEIKKEDPKPVDPADKSGEM